MEERLSMKQVAERLGVSVDTIRRRLKKGELAGLP
jgi:excisionase family DNA binding protein